MSTFGDHVFLILSLRLPENTQFCTTQQFDKPVWSAVCLLWIRRSDFTNSKGIHPTPEGMFLEYFIKLLWHEIWWMVITVMIFMVSMSCSMPHSAGYVDLVKVLEQWTLNNRTETCFVLEVVRTCIEWWLTLESIDNLMKKCVEGSNIKIY